MDYRNCTSLLCCSVSCTYYFRNIHWNINYWYSDTCREHPVLHRGVYSWMYGTISCMVIFHLILEAYRVIQHRGFYTYATFGFYNIVKGLTENKNFWENVMFSDFVWGETRSQLIADGYDKDDDDLDSHVYDQLLESLAYWNIFYEPNRMNEAIAIDCNLVPFTYNDIELIALGGLGMDLSPKLDAYQALVSKTIDGSSKYFKEREYFIHVVGEHMMIRIENAIMTPWRQKERMRIANQVHHP